MTFTSTLLGKANEIVVLCARHDMGKIAKLLPADHEFMDKVKEPYSDIIARYRPFTDQNPADFDTIIGGVDAAIRELNNPEVEVESIANQVADWHGNAALNFRDRFTKRFPIVRTNQVMVMERLKTTAEGCKKIIETYRTDILKIADDTIAALKKIKKDEPGMLDWTLAITGLIAFGAAAVSGGAGFVLAGLTIGNAVDTVNQQLKVTIEGGSIPEVIASMDQAIHTLNVSIAAQEQELIKALTSDTQAVEESMRILDDPAVLLPPPTIALPGPGRFAEFKPPTVPRG